MNHRYIAISGVWLTIFLLAVGARSGFGQTENKGQFTNIQSTTDGAYFNLDLSQVQYFADKHYTDQVPAMITVLQLSHECGLPVTVASSPLGGQAIDAQVLVSSIKMDSISPAATTEGGEAPSNQYTGRLTKIEANMTGTYFNIDSFSGQFLIKNGQFAAMDEVLLLSHECNQPVTVFARPDGEGHYAVAWIKLVGVAPMPVTPITTQAASNLYSGSLTMIQAAKEGTYFNLNSFTGQFFVNNGQVPATVTLLQLSHDLNLPVTVDAAPDGDGHYLVSWVRILGISPTPSTLGGRSPNNQYAGHLIGIQSCVEGTYFTLDDLGGQLFIDASETDQVSAMVSVLRLDCQWNAPQDVYALPDTTGHYSVSWVRRLTPAEAAEGPEPIAVDAKRPTIKSVTISPASVNATSSANLHVQFTSPLTDNTWISFTHSTLNGTDSTIKSYPLDAQLPKGVDHYDVTIDTDVGSGEENRTQFVAIMNGTQGTAELEVH